MSRPKKTISKVKDKEKKQSSKAKAAPKRVAPKKRKDSIVNKVPKPKLNTLSTAKRRSQQEKEDLRKKFKAAEYINQLEFAYAKFEAILEELEDAAMTRAKLKKSNTVESRTKIREMASRIDLLRIRLDVIKYQIDLNIRRLRFCLPELKAVEMSDPSGGNPFEAFMTAVHEACES